MEIKVGTIQELTGQGYEILVDVATRSMILARFFDGKLIREVALLPSSDEPTLAPTA